MPEPPTPKELAARRGRRIGTVIFGLFVGSITALWGGQILVQAFSDPPSESSATCAKGVAGLHAAVRKAAQEASTVSGERAALDQFRRSIEPGWSRRAGILQACQGNPQGEQALSALRALRYAEEQALRYTAVEVEPHRQRAQAALQKLEPSAASASSAPLSTP